MFAKARISHVGKDFGDPPAGPPLDFFVEVEELDVELLGKQAADTALAAATRPASPAAPEAPETIRLSEPVPLASSRTA